VDYGAALEMRFGVTRRGFESRPLRHTGWRLDADGGVVGCAPSLTHFDSALAQVLASALPSAPIHQPASPETS
jgi:hypothetical protein